MDSRPIDCKIYSYSVDWDNVDWGENKVVNLSCQIDIIPERKTILLEYQRSGIYLMKLKK